MSCGTAANFDIFKRREKKRAANGCSVVFLFFLVYRRRLMGVSCFVFCCSLSKICTCNESDERCLILKQ